MDRRTEIYFLRMWIRLFDLFSRIEGVNTKEVQNIPDSLDVTNYHTYNLFYTSTFELNKYFV